MALAALSRDGGLAGGPGCAGNTPQAALQPSGCHKPWVIPFLFALVALFALTQSWARCQQAPKGTHEPAQESTTPCPRLQDTARDGGSCEGPLGRE